MPDGLILTPEEAAAYSTRLSTEDSEQARINAIKAKYAKPSLKMKRVVAEPLLSKKDIRELMIQGAKIEDIYEIAYLSAETGLDPFELLALYTKRGISWDELRQNLKAKGGSTSVTEEAYGVTDNVYSKLEDLIINPTSSLAALSTKSVSTLDMAITSVIDDFKMEAINQVGKPQFSDRSLSSESVDPASGTLTWKDTQISLPGRDGLDLNIGVMYDSNDSEFISDSNIPNLNRNVQYDLGTGWSFQFPSITSEYYHDGEGGTYKYFTDAIHGMEGGFYQYKGKDKRIFLDNGSFNNGDFLSNTYVEYANGKREYFGEPGLLGIVDRFGNTITFKYGLYWHTDNWQSKYLITQIIDSVGRVVDFNYDWINSRKAEANIDLPDENLTITVKDLNNTVSQKVVYTRARVGYWYKKYLGIIDGVDKFYGEWEERTSPELKYITLQNGEQLKFNYVREDYVYNTKFKPEKLDIKQNYSYEAGNELLSSIEYPHSRTVYEMGYQARNMGPYGSIDTPIVKTRYDQVLKSGGYSGRYNETTYSYNGSYDGYTTYYGPDLVPASHTYSSVMHNVSDNLNVTRTFNGKGQFLSAVSQAANGERKVEKNTVFHSVITQLPTATETWEYGPGDTDSTANKLYSETSYDDWGNVLTATRPMLDNQWNNPTLKAKNTTAYTYEPNYHLLNSKSWYASESDPSALSESYSYNGQGRVLRTTNAAGETTSFTYENAPDGTKRLYKTTAEKTSGGKTVTKSVVTYGVETQYAYPTVEEAYSNIGQSNQQIVKTSTAYDMGTGRVIEKRDGNQNATLYAYDAAGRLKKETQPNRTNAKGELYSEVTDYNYYNQTSGNFDSVNTGTEVLKVDSIHTLTNLSNQNAVKTYANVLYNGLGLTLLEEHFDENTGKWVFTQYHYDDQGRPVYSIDPAANTLTVSYDAWGRQNRATNANGDLIVNDYSLKARTSTSYIQDKSTGEKLNYVQDSYDAWGNKISASTYKDWPTNSNKITESYRYNISGNVTGYTDPNQNLNEDGVTTTYAYDVLGRLAAVKDALNQTTSYSYDGNGLLSKVTIQAKNGTPQTLNTKTYNELGLPTVKQDGASQSESYTYNTLGQLAAKTDRNGSTFGYTYDESGQLKKSTIRGMINNVAQTQETNVIFGDGTPKQQTIQTLMNNAVTATQTQTLDSLGQVRNRYSLAGDHSANIGNQLDVVGRMTQINDSYMGFYSNYQYDKQRLDKVQTNGSSTLTSAASTNVQYSYFANNLVNTIAYPTLIDGSKIVTTYTYNKALGWIESMTNTKRSSVLSGYSYSYDNNGNQITVSESRNDGAAQTTSYGYDSLNRLVSITRPDGGKTTYTYDVRGNRQTISDTSNVSLDTVDTGYTYDLQNTLTSVTKGASATSFKYYADGMRYLKTNGNTQTQVNYNFQGQVISEEKIVSGVYTEQANFVRGDRVLVKKDKKASKDYYYLYNGHGDVVQMVDTSGAVVNNYTYDEWGNITSQLEGTSNSFKYTGEVYDAETGLYYLRARYYDPSMGRFLNEDTVEGQIDNPLSQNLYTYVHNNPLIYSDPSGHMMTRGADSIGSDGGSSGDGLEFVHFSDMNQIELTQIMGDERYSSGVRSAAAAEFVKRNFMLVENGAVKAASGIKALINSAKKALKAEDVVKATSKTGTVWDSIKATQSAYEGTSIPKSFNIKVGDQDFWVNPNGTKHMLEYITSGGKNIGTTTSSVSSQSILTEFQSAFTEAIKNNGVVFDKMIRGGNWEFMLSAPREPGLNVVVKHARYNP
ncbi:hypothetical protein A3848_13160 [Paenibacillus sp. P32E]|nr:hypothetical protein A3848_13160 [Paenibacillus sp. P32E]